MSVWPVVIVTFLSVATIIYLIASNSTRFAQRYRTTFTEQASFNLSDMFMFMDPSALFRFNIGAMIVVPVLLRDVLHEAIDAPEDEPDRPHDADDEEIEHRRHTSMLMILRHI